MMPSVFDPTSNTQIIARMLAFGNQSPRYHQNVVRVSMRYRFKPATPCCSPDRAAVQPMPGRA